MNIEKTPITGLLIITPKIFSDDRGYFYESYNKERFAEAGITDDFVQDNESKSSFGVIRGLHYQLEPFAQSKLVRVLKGSVYDIAVDIRKGSPTFGKWFGIELTGENKKQFYIPKGFAHGFSVLSKEAVFSYKCNNNYNPGSERGIAYNDPTLNINWEVDIKDAIISEKDKVNPLLKDAEINFNY
jgi:dTDP-4-dehydrorhamnose 3,5-epimerase